MLARARGKLIGVVFSKPNITFKLLAPMARRSRIALCNPFQRLPRNLAREITLYLDPFRVENIQQFVDLARVCPTGYLSISLEFALTAEDRSCIEEMVDDEALTALTFDVSIHCTQGRLDTELVKILLQSARVEGLTLYNVSINLQENMTVFKYFAASKNSAHIVHFRGEGGDDEDSQRSTLDGARRVADFLRTDGCLVSLNMRCRSSQIIPKTFRRAGFWVGLHSNRSVRYLELFDVGLDSEDAALLCEALMNLDCRIEYLDIGANAIGDEGVLAIARCLKTNNQLRYLLQGSVDATARGGIALAEALCKNTTLELLSMKDDPLGPTAGKAFASMLEANSSLQFLGLDYCEFESEGCRYFIDALAVNKTLKTLRLNHNGICRQDQSDLVRVATQTGVLTRLEVADKNLLVDGQTRPGRSVVAAHNFLGGSYLGYLRGHSTLSKRYGKRCRSGVLDAF